MKIETKYSMGDAAFVMYNNRAVPIKIMGVHYSIDVYQGERVYYSAERATGVRNGNISSCVKGRCKTAGGYIWKLYKEKR